MSDKIDIRDTAQAVKGLLEAVPVYQDTIQPAAREVGKGLQTVAKTIHLALAPVSALVWGFETIRDFVSTRVAQKLKDIPPEQIRTPELNVVGPALEALRYTGNQETLRELYANLLANSLDAETAAKAHPAFVDIIRSLSPDEARILRVLATQPIFPVIDAHRVNITSGDYEVIGRNYSLIGRKADCEHAGLTQSYLENLARLGLLELPDQNTRGPELHDKGQYDTLEDSDDLKPLKKSYESITSHKLTFRHGYMSLTEFGIQFCQACVADRSVESAAPAGNEH